MDRLPLNCSSSALFVSLIEIFNVATYKTAFNVCNVKSVKVMGLSHVTGVESGETISLQDLTVHY